MANGERLIRDRYLLGERLGRNGASSTWAARDTRSDTRCVVKELSVGAVVREGSGEHSWDGDFTKLIDLFEREARVLAHLDHPGIPRFVDHFRAEVEGDLRLYTVQEFVDGSTLDQLVRSGRHFTEDEAVRICRDVTEVLAYLHDRSPPLVHRDVKPSNVILGPDGRVHLVDFGSVRNLVDSDPLDGKTIVGTYGYMPMEQYEGRAVPQSDFYALGMTLVFLLSHRDPTTIPRTGLTLDFRSHVRVSERFARLITWMITATPEDRPPDAAAILDLLSPSRRNLPDLLPAVGTGAEGGPPAKRTEPGALRSNVALAAGTAFLFIAVLGLVFGAIPLGLFLLEDDGAVAPGGSVEGEPPDAGREAPLLRVRRAVQPVDGVLTIDIDRDFTYEPTGWPMGRSVGQTTLPSLSGRVPYGVQPPATEDPVWYGAIPLGNDGFQVDFALVVGDDGPSLIVDANANRDLADDGPGYPNEGSGPLHAAHVTLSARVIADDSRTLTRRYGAWIWFTERGEGAAPYARMYARHHYSGIVLLGDERFDATVFEYLDHDARYRDDGVCIDLDHDDSCDEAREIFRDGDVLRHGARDVRVRLAYP